MLANHNGDCTAVLSRLVDNLAARRRFILINDSPAKRAVYASNVCVLRIGYCSPIFKTSCGHLRTVDWNKLTTLIDHLDTIGYKCGKKRASNVYDHITLKTPVLVRSPKLSNVERG